MRHAYYIDPKKGNPLKVEKLDEHTISLVVGSTEILLNHSNWDDLKELVYKLYISPEVSNYDAA